MYDVCFACAIGSGALAIHYANKEDKQMWYFIVLTGIYTLGAILLA